MPWKTAPTTGKRIRIDGDIYLTVIRDRNGAKKLEIDAPDDVTIELLEEK